MIKISRNEADYLRENGRGEDVKMTNVTHKSRSKTYYAVEHYKTLALLTKIRGGVL